MINFCVFDHRGKAMVSGGRYRLAQHLRWLRRSGGRAYAQSALDNAKEAYASEMRRAHEREAGEWRALAASYDAQWHRLLTETA